MSQETETKQETAGVENVEASASTVATTERPAAPRRKPAGKGGRPPRSNDRQPRDFEQKIISIRRVTRVVSGGRRFSFSVAMVIGDGRGSVGVGMGKAGDTSLAIQKAISDAKKSMIKIHLNDAHSINHEIDAKYKSAKVTIMPNYGRGVVAGSAVRSIFELAGMKDITAKVLTRTKNKVNIARATVEALRPFVTSTGNAAVQNSLKSTSPKTDSK
jgi:small subunit ribosomal protein S5